MSPDWTKCADLTAAASSPACLNLAARVSSPKCAAEGQIKTVRSFLYPVKSFGHDGAPLIRSDEAASTVALPTRVVRCMIRRIVYCHKASPHAVPDDGKLRQAPCVRILDLARKVRLERADRLVMSEVTEEIGRRTMGFLREYPPDACPRKCVRARQDTRRCRCVRRHGSERL